MMISIPILMSTVWFLPGLFCVQPFWISMKTPLRRSLERWRMSLNMSHWRSLECNAVWLNFETVRRSFEGKRIWIRKPPNHAVSHLTIWHKTCQTKNSTALRFVWGLYVAVTLSNGSKNKSNTTILDALWQIYSCKSKTCCFNSKIKQK